MLREESVKKVQVVCPVCGIKEIVSLPTVIIRNSSHLTTVSIPSGKVCEHHFQIFIDKAFNVRGYQKVDFELKTKKNTLNEHNNSFINGLELYQNKSKLTSTSKKVKQSVFETKDDKVLRKIYEEFWEFINEDNKIFEKFILDDKRRKKISLTFGRVNVNKSWFAELAQKAD